MTTGDFLEYYKNQKEPNYMQQTPKSAAAQTREFKSTPPVRRSETEATGRSAAGNGMRPARPVKKFDPKADTIVMPAQKPTGIKRKLSAIVGRWFPAEDREDRKEKTTVFKRDLPVAVIGLMAALSVAMTMIIGSGVMVSEASMEVSELKSDISVLENECDKLNEELTKKENLAEIQAYAENGLGMISKNYAASEYIEIAGGNSVQDYSEDEKPIVGFGTLLNAIFGE